MAAAVVAGAMLLIAGHGRPATVHPTPRRTAEPAAIPAASARHGVLEIDSRTHRAVRLRGRSLHAPGGVRGFGARWIADTSGVTRVDAAAGSVSRVGFAGGASSLAVAGKSLWVTDPRDTAGLYQIDPGIPRIVRRLRLPGHPLGRVFAGLHYLWVPCRDFLAQIDPHTGRLVARLPVRPNQSGGDTGVVTFGAGSVWVVDSHAGELDTSRPGVLYRIDPRSHTVTARIPMAALNWYDEFRLGYAGGLIWVADLHRGILYAVSPQVDAVTHARRLGPIENIAIGTRRIWVVTPGRHLTELETDARPIWRALLPFQPGSIGIDGARLWVSESLQTG